MKITIGADPEFFVTNEEGKIIPAIGMSKGTKENPEPLSNGGALQVDGLALEFNIDPVEIELPEKNDLRARNISNVLNMSDVFSKRILSTRNSSLKLARENIKLKIGPSKKSFTTFTKKEFESFPKEALIQGCDPDFNAWTGEVNDPPPADTHSRAVGGHVHIGWGDGFDVEDQGHIDMCASIVRQMDFALGLPSIVTDRKGADRRSLYGKAGAFRPKPYGVEYRSLSNYWLSGVATTQKMFINLIQGLMDYKSDRIYENIYGDIQNIINTSDVRMANDKCRELGFLI